MTVVHCTLASRQRAFVQLRLVREKLLDHGLREPIFSVHLSKTTAAFKDECQPASPTSRQAQLAALNRFLNSPVKGKQVRRLARQAIVLVARDFD